MREFLARKPEAMRRLTQEKVRKIEEIIRNGDTYVETNHCFIKGFGWFIPEYLPEDEIGVIILTRAKQSIAKSLLRIGCSPIGPWGREWVITPGINDPLVPPPGRFLSARSTYIIYRILMLGFRGRRFYRALNLRPPCGPHWMSRYELDCLEWYVQETLALAKVYQERFRDIRCMQVSLGELNTFQGFKNVLNYFGCTERSTIHEVIGEPTNLMR